METKCVTCKFWVRDGKGITQGKCHRRPPALMGVEIGQNLLGKPQKMFMFSFPSVGQDNWCGDFEAKLSEVN